MSTGPSAVTTTNAALIRFPSRRASCVWIMREDSAWLVLANDHGWLFGSFSAALSEAHWLARNLGLPIRHQKESHRVHP
jgi:hypothetical protein